MEEVKNMGRERYTEHLKEKYEVNTVTENDRITTGDGDNHLYTWERIYHFSCGICKNWWSYAVIPNVIYGADMHLPSNMDYFCPHCGADEKVKVKEGFLNV